MHANGLLAVIYLRVLTESIYHPVYGLNYQAVGNTILLFMSYALVRAVI